MAYMYVASDVFCCLFQLPAAVGEAPTFGFSEDMANQFFNPDGVRTAACTMWIFLKSECTFNA